MNRTDPAPLTAALAAALLLFAPAAAQEDVEPLCPQGRVEHIFVDNHSIFDTSDPELDPRFEWIYRTANRLHVRTRESFIRRELLFDVGDCYDPLLIEESARLLRGYGFIGTADVYGIQQPGGGYHVVVDTEDEWSTRLEVRADLSGRFELEGVDLAERNLAGRGQHLGVFYRSDRAIRTYGARYGTPQLFGTRWDLEVAAGRTRSGTLVHQEIAYPFVGEVGRWGFRQLFARQDRLFDYVLPLGHAGCPDEDTRCRVLVPFREKGGHVLSVWRFGDRGNMTVMGGGLSYQEVSYPGDPESAITLVRRGDYDARTPAPPELREPAAARTDHMRNLRAVALIGKRNIAWQTRQGLDSFRGDEDVRIGAEVEVALARSLPGLESDDDLYGTLDIYAGAGPAAAFFATRVRADARRDYDARPEEFELKDVFAEGEVFVYLAPPWLESHTFLFRVAGAGGWHVATPFQLTLGGERALRGWPEDALPGGRRIVATVEDRWFIGWPLPDVMDFGMSIFADAGRIWAGDSPFGRDSGWQASVGLGLRANFPAGGSNAFRVDAAFPIGPDGGLGRLQLLIGVGEYVGLSADRTDPQFDRSRMPPITGNLLHFPN